MVRNARKMVYRIGNYKIPLRCLHEELFQRFRKDNEVFVNDADVKTGAQRESTALLLRRKWKKSVKLNKENGCEQ